MHQSLQEAFLWTSLVICVAEWPWVTVRLLSDHLTTNPSIFVRSPNPVLTFFWSDPRRARFPRCAGLQRGFPWTARGATPAPGDRGLRTLFHGYTTNTLVTRKPCRSQRAQRLRPSSRLASRGAGGSTSAASRGKFTRFVSIVSRKITSGGNPDTVLGCPHVSARCDLGLHNFLRGADRTAGNASALDRVSLRFRSR